MSELRLTPTRLALLRDVAEGFVSEYYPMLPDPAYSSVMARGGYRRRKVTAAIAELNRAGWVRLGAPGDYYKAPRLWEITDEGRAVLDGAS